MASVALSSVCVLRSVRAFVVVPVSTTTTTSSCTTLSSVVDRDTAAVATAPTTTNDDVLHRLREAAASSSRDWGDAFGHAPSSPECGFHALFRAVREAGVLGFGYGVPFRLTAADLAAVDDVGSFDGFFRFADLEQAMEDDFLDADRGSTDNRKGWKIAAAVSEPKGSSFEAARMTFEDIQLAMEKGTVIFNSIGAHIPKLASAALACTDATSLPCAVNMYLTAPNKRTSAPPHTDKQDVVVVQTEGTKHWRVFDPPDTRYREDADPFARGKGRDNMPLYSLLDGNEGGSRLLLDLVLETGDVLFIPAGFPHTTDTVNDNGGGGTVGDDPSVHLTFGLDTHVWDLDYLSLRRFALRKAGVHDTKLGQVEDEDNRYVGKINALEDQETRFRLLEHLPLGFLDDEGGAVGNKDATASVAAELTRIAHAVDEETARAAEAVDPNIWSETTARVRTQGMRILDTHRDMYLAAVQEGEFREAERKMNAHLLNNNNDGKPSSLPMTQERMQRLSCFRVKKFYDRVNDHMAETLEWKQDCLGERTTPTTNKDGKSVEQQELPPDWEFTTPLKVGDAVEADLGGAFFPGKVVNVKGGGDSKKFDVLFFDGDSEQNLTRDMVKLMTPPVMESTDSTADDIDTSGLTKKELKKLRKKQEKLARKKNK